MNSKLLPALGLSRKAGKLLYGFDAVAAAIRGGTARLVLTSNDLSPKSLKEIRMIAEKHKTELMEADITMDEISARIGHRAGILAVCDSSLAGAVKIAAGHDKKIICP